MFFSNRIYLMLISIMLPFTGCGESSQLTEQELRRDPEITPFMQDMTSYLSGMHKVDLGDFKFEYITGSSAEMFFASIDKQANASGWIRIYNRAFEHHYIKKNNNHYRIVYVIYSGHKISVKGKYVYAN